MAAILPEQLDKLPIRASTAPTLPNELLGMIVKTIAVCDANPCCPWRIAINRLHQRTLYSLCLVARKFYHMALPELYSAYSVTIGPIMEDFCIQKALQNLLWTLSWRPDLGKLVKVVILEPSFAESGRDYNKCPEKYRELGPGIDQAFEALPDGVRQSWRKYLTDKDERTAIALLLALSPNVVHLDVMKPSRFRWSLFWSHSILAGMKSKMCLTKLEHLSIVSAVGHECTVDVADFLAVPSLRSFYGARIGFPTGTPIREIS